MISVQCMTRGTLQNAHYRGVIAIGIPMRHAGAGQLLRIGRTGKDKPRTRAPSRAMQRSFWWSLIRKPGSKLRSIIRSPCTSSTRNAANPPISASRTRAGLAPALKFRLTMLSNSCSLTSWLGVAGLRTVPRPPGGPTLLNHPESRELVEGDRAAKAAIIPTRSMMEPRTRRLPAPSQAPYPCRCVWQKAPYRRYGGGRSRAGW